jgi:hypothetical protein
MLVPWLRIIDAALGMRDAARQKTQRSADDARRLDIERERLEAERVRAERALKIELLRQAGDREIGRLRLVAGLAIVSWVGALVVSVTLVAPRLGARLLVGAGWLALIGAVLTALSAQVRVERQMAHIADEHARIEDLSSGLRGSLSPWLIAFGLALVGLATLV